MPRYKQLLKKYQWALWSGLLIGTSYIPFAPWASLFGFVPLWLSVTTERRTFKDVVIQGWLTQFFLTLIGFHWIAYTAHDFGYMPWILALLVLFAFCALAHWYIPLAIGIWWHVNNRWELTRSQSLAILAIFTILGEFAWPSIFPWNFGYTWYWSGLPVYQIADLIGFQGLSALTIGCNAVLAKAWLDHRSGHKSMVTTKIAAVVVVFLLLNVLGSQRVKKWNQTDSEIHILQVQANIGNFDKLMAEKGGKFRQIIIDKYIALTEQGLKENPGMDLIVWPETAYPDLLDQAYLVGKNQQRLIEFQKSHGIPLLTGAYSKEGPETGKDFYDRLTYNGLFLMDGQGVTTSPTYRKSVLLAFGEYLPFSDTFPIIKKLVPEVGNFGRGPGPTVYPFKDYRFGLQICYEGLYPDFSRTLVGSLGADLLFNVTNDSWFGRPFEPYQHLYMTLSRAIETRRPMIRNTNTGVSTVALANGQVLAQSPLMKEWTGAYTVKFKKDPPLTFYVVYGPFWTYLLGLGALGLILTRKKRARLDSSRLDRSSKPA